MNDETDGLNLSAFFIVHQSSLIVLFLAAGPNRPEPKLGSLNYVKVSL